MTIQSEQAKGLEEAAIQYAKDFVYPVKEITDLFHDVEQLTIQRDQLLQSQPGIKQWVSDIIAELSEVIDEQADRQRFGMDHTQGVNEGLRMAIRRLDKIPNSITTPKSDMVSKAQICKLLESEKIDSGKRAPQITVFETLHNQHIDEIITKIKEICPTPSE